MNNTLLTDLKEVSPTTNINRFGGGADKSKNEFIETKCKQKTVPKSNITLSNYNVEKLECISNLLKNYNETNKQYIHIYSIYLKESAGYSNENFLYFNKNINSYNKNITKILNLLRDFPERNTEENQFSVFSKNKLTDLTEASTKPNINYSERNVEKNNYFSQQTNDFSECVSKVKDEFTEMEHSKIDFVEVPSSFSIDESKDILLEMNCKEVKSFDERSQDNSFNLNENIFKSYEEPLEVTDNMLFYEPFLLNTTPDTSSLELEPENTTPDASSIELEQENTTPDTSSLELEPENTPRCSSPTLRYEESLNNSINETLTFPSSTSENSSSSPVLQTTENAPPSLQSVPSNSSLDSVSSSPNLSTTQNESNIESNIESISSIVNRIISLISNRTTRSGLHNTQPREVRRNRVTPPIISLDRFNESVEFINYTENMNNNEIRCPISLEDFSLNEVICRIKECSHIFKINPLISWMKVNTYCPVCRFDLNRQPETTSTLPSLNENLSQESNLNDESIADISLTLYYYREPIVETPGLSISGENIPTYSQAVRNNLPLRSNLNRSSSTLRTNESLNTRTNSLRRNLHSPLQSTTNRSSHTSRYRDYFDIPSNSTTNRSSSMGRSNESLDFINSFFRESLRQTVRNNLPSQSTTNTNSSTVPSEEIQTSSTNRPLQEPSLLHSTSENFPYFTVSQTSENIPLNSNSVTNSSILPTNTIPTRENLPSVLPTSENVPLRFVEPLGNFINRRTEDTNQVTIEPGIVLSNDVFDYLTGYEEDDNLINFFANIYI
jgi:hypothetical protein